MKELSFLVLVSLFLPTGYPVGEIIATKDTKLIDAIMYVESRGDSMAYNRGEDAVGVLQIRPIMLREVNRLLGYDRYNLKDRWSKAKSIEMFEIIRQNIVTHNVKRILKEIIYDTKRKSIFTT